MASFFDVEYEIEKGFTKGLRAIFEKDSRFVYNKNQKETEILITTEYPDSADAMDKLPHIVITGVTYQNNLHNSFGYNFFRDSSYKGLKNGTQQYAYIFPYSVTLLCSGDKNVSKDLASRVNWYLSFGATKFMSENLELQISEIQKGNASPSKQFPVKIFDTAIQVRGTLYWIGTKGPEDALADIDKPLQNVKINF